MLCSWRWSCCGLVDEVFPAKALVPAKTSRSCSSVRPAVVSLLGLEGGRGSGLDTTYRALGDAHLQGHLLLGHPQQLAKSLRRHELNHALSNRICQRRNGPPPLDIHGCIVESDGCG